ncbi:MAG: 3-keto-disaccharide hydrolase, partial [Candidatus Hinthialibacter sp.]
IMVNGAKGNTTNIYSEYEHGDCLLHIEFVVPQGSNSGVYLQGLYEIQVLDSYGKKDDELEFSDCGGMYARWDHETQKSYEGEPPRVNASKAPGEWQSFDAVFRAPRFDAQGKKVENARFIVVKHNGVIVHENYEITGGTRACMNRKEGPKGPLMLQGDHGPVAYRNIQITPLKLQ